MKVAAIQMVSSAQTPDNLRHARALLEQAALAGAQLAALPEYWSCMGLAETDKLARSEAFGDGPVQQFLAQAARELSLWIVGGTLPLASAEPGRVYNSSLVYSPRGECVARYDKIHLFRFDNGREAFDEARTIAPGSQPLCLALDVGAAGTWQVGLSICYDLRFAELYRAHARAGAQLLLVPSAFTHTTGQAHWEVLLRARAVENLAYVLAPAQGGWHENGRRTWGHSMAVDPWGEVMALQAEGPGVVLAQLDAERLRQVRAQLPALSHAVL